MVKIRTALQGIICSMIIHIIYFLYIWIGYINSKNYIPEVFSKNQTAYVLQNKASIVLAFPPEMLLLSFTGLSVICGFLIFIYKKRTEKN